MAQKSDRGWFKELVIAIRTWFQPYYRPKPVKNKTKRATKPGSTKAGSTKAGVTKKAPAPVSPPSKQPAPTPGAQPPIRIVDYPKPLDKVASFTSKPGLNRIWCYHDSTRHQVAAHLGPGTGYKFRERSDVERRKLKPSVFPIQNVPFDRTHLIPIGYHGSENDHRLLIGWESEANRNQFNDFEQKQKARKQPILWTVFVTKTAEGATWDYTVYDSVSMKKLDHLTHKMVGEFAWKA